MRIIEALNAKLAKFERKRGPDGLFLNADGMRKQTEYERLKAEWDDEKPKG